MSFKVSENSVFTSKMLGVGWVIRYVHSDTIRVFGDTGLNKMIDVIRDCTIGNSFVPGNMSSMSFWVDETDGNDQLTYDYQAYKRRYHVA